MTIQTEPEPQAIRRVAFLVAEIARLAHKVKETKGEGERGRDVDI